MDILTGLLNGVIKRPYVFLFLAVHLFLSIRHLGWRRALLFTGIGYLTALVCEASSIRNGFPFGLYYYRPEGFEGELTVFGVPYWDSLSFPFLTYFSYTVALFLYGPLYKAPRDLQVLETKKLRRSPAVLLTAALFMAVLDTAIDPITLQGDKWFLGNIYYYPNGGAHFGVPISNYLGWYFVGFVTLVLYAFAEARLFPPAKGDESGCRHTPFGALAGSAVYLGVVLYMLAVTLYVGDYTLATASTLVFILPLAMGAARILSAPPPRQEEISAHVQDFPVSPTARKYFQD
ncbi:MAG: carotenoid biosynthesis protein [Bdellovibrionota bacterium]